MSVSKPLYAAANLVEAQLLLDLLQEAGVRVALRNENLTGMVGLLPESATHPTIWVEDADDWESGRAVVAAFEARSKTNVDAEITCPACGEANPVNFELCWKCRAQLLD
jgi:hypothetical protein